MKGWLSFIDWRTLPLGREHSTVEGLQQFLQTELQDVLRKAPNLRVMVQETHTKQRAYTGWERTMPIFTHGFEPEEKFKRLNRHDRGRALTQNSI
jgi:hypothetical protein